MSSHFKYRIKQRELPKVKKTPSSNVLIWGIRCLFVFLFFISLYVFFYSSFFKINTIDINVSESDTQIQKQNINILSIETFVKQYLQKTHYLIFSNENFFLLNTNEIKTLLKETYQLTDVTVEKKPLTGLIIHLQIPKESALWFDGTTHTYIDEYGVALQEAPIERYYLNVHISDILKDLPELKTLVETHIRLTEEAEEDSINQNDKQIDFSHLDISSLPKEQFDTVQKRIKEKTLELLLEQRKERQKSYIEYALLEESGAQPNSDIPVYSKDQFVLPVIFDESKAMATKGSHVLSDNQVTFITQVIKHIPEYIQAQPLLFVIEEKQHPHIKLYVDQGYYIYFNTLNDIGKQLNKLSLVLEQKIHYPQDLNYVDVRFDDKVYFKYKGQ